MKFEWGHFRELGGEAVSENLERFHELCQKAFYPHEGKERTRWLNELMPPLITIMVELRNLAEEEILRGAEEGEVLNMTREPGDLRQIRNYDRERFSETFRESYLKKLADTEDFITASEYYQVNVRGKKRDIQREYDWMADLVRFPGRAKRLPENVKASLLDFVGNDVPSLVEREIGLS